MALSEEHINDRLDRLAGDIRDETAGRREDRSELRSELWAQGRELRKQIWDEIGEVRKTTQKEIDGLWKILLAIAVALVVAVSIAVDDADAAPLMNSPSAHHWAPISAAPVIVRADQRLDDLNEKISDGADQLNEDLRRLRSHTQSSLEEMREESRDRAIGLFALTLGLISLLFFIGTIMTI